MYYSPAGNGVCHQVHMERFGIPGKTAARVRQSHARGRKEFSVLGIGAGGLDVAMAMAGLPYMSHVRGSLELSLLVNCLIG